MSDMQTTNDLIDMVRQRAEAGMVKYGVTLDRTDLNQADWLQHLLEELLDGAGYVLAAKRRAAETETAVVAAFDLLELGDVAGAKAVLGSILPAGHDVGSDVLIRDAGGA